MGREAKGYVGGIVRLRRPNSPLVSKEWRKGFSRIFIYKPQSSSTRSSNSCFIPSCPASLREVQAV